MGITWSSRDPLNEMSTKDCFVDRGQNKPIYGQRLEISIFKTVGA